MSKFAPSLQSGSTRLRIGLDIDETLCYAVMDWVRDLSLKYGGMPGMTHDDVIKAYGYAQHVPVWKDHPEALAWMDWARADSEYHKQLSLFPGAQDAVLRLSECVDLGPYITMRNPLVIEATRQWLLANGFPNEEIICPPVGHPFELRYRWKAETLVALFPAIHGIVDDHAGVVKELPPDYKGVVFLLGHTEAPRSDINVIPCPSWSEVEVAIVRYARAIALSPTV